MIEVSTFRLLGEVSESEFLEKNAEFQQRFVYQQEGLVRRTLASGLDDVWASITWWRSMKDARRSAAEALGSPIAMAFAAQLDPGSITTEYFKELPG
jgi:hypothetical protein